MVLIRSKYEMNFTSISIISTDHSEKIANLLQKLFHFIMDEVVISELSCTF